MKRLFLLIIIILTVSCGKDEVPFNFLQTDADGNIIGGDTTIGILKQDALLTEGTDSICSQLLFLKEKKLRGCNGNVKVLLYPNPIKANQRLYLKVISDRPLYSNCFATSERTSMTLAGRLNGVTTFTSDITHTIPSTSTSSYEFYIATTDSCVYHGYYNLKRE